MLIQIWVAINSVAGRSTTGNVGERLIGRIQEVMLRFKTELRSKTENLVPCDRLLSLKEKSCQRTYTMLMFWLQ